MGGNTATKAAKPGPDNNKRLAELESGVAALAVALAANGIELAAGADPLQEAIEAVKSRARLVAGLESSSAKIVAALQSAGVEIPDGADLDDLVAATIAKGPDTVSDGELAAIDRAVKAEAELTKATETLSATTLELTGLQEDLDTANSEKNRLAAELAAALEGTVTITVAAEAEPEAPTPRERPEHARDFGPHHDDIATETLAELVDGEGESGKLEIAFSNGEYELVELAPVEITAADLASNGGRRCVQSSILVRGGKHREEIHGAALLLEGEQIHYCAFPDPLVIEPGQERQFVKAIYFD